VTACTKPVNIRMDIRLVTAIEKEAQKDNLTKTDVVLKIVKQHYGKSIPGFCPYCGKENEMDSKFCSECGKELKQ